MIGLLCAPLTFFPTTATFTTSSSTITPTTTAEPAKSKSALHYINTSATLILLNLLSPPIVLLAGCWYAGVSVETVLTQAAFGWDVWGMWTQVIVWCVWWPAWVVGGALVGRELF